MPSSMSDAVGVAAAAMVAALGITVPGSAPSVAVPVVRRKTPSVPEGASQGLPQFVVTVGEEGPTEYLTATTKLKTYPVAVTIVTNMGQRAADDVTVRQWRQQIELAVESRTNWTTGANAVAGWSEVDVTNKAPFDMAALSKDYDYSPVIVTVQVVEARE